MGDVWHKSNYKLMTGKWKIGIILEAGYQIFDSSEYLSQPYLPIHRIVKCSELSRYYKIEDSIYFRTILLPYPDSQPLTDEEIFCFCEGLNRIKKYLLKKIAPGNFMIISLHYIQFSDCNIQKEAFTMAAIQWASEVFNFPMPEVRIFFDCNKSENGLNGTYIFDFLSLQDE